MIANRNLFVKCIDVKETENRTEIKCKLGLWSVIGASYTTVSNEAYHYWQQYYADGEYSELLA